MNGGVSQIARVLQSVEGKSRPRCSTKTRINWELFNLAEGGALIIAHEEKSWASITFSGSRHEVKLEFEGEKAVKAGEEFVALLPDHEFFIPGQLVADATVCEVDQQFGDDERMTVTAVLLLLEEGE